MTGKEKVCIVIILKKHYSTWRSLQLEDSFNCLKDITYEKKNY